MGAPPLAGVEVVGVPERGVSSLSHLEEVLERLWDLTLRVLVQKGQGRLAWPTWETPTPESRRSLGTPGW